MIKDQERRRLYSTWRGMHARCYRTTDPKYKDYGGRGIRVCERWHLFQNFVSDMAPRPVKHSVDRINNDGDYDPSNCRWATQHEQTRNTRFNHRLKDGRLVRDVARDNGVPIETARHRFLRGWPEAEIFAPAWEKKRSGSLKTQCDAAGLPYGAVWKRIKMGWSINDALLKPIRQAEQK